jgi:hypothetical protein
VAVIAPTAFAHLPTVAYCEETSGQSTAVAETADIEISVTAPAIPPRAQPEKPIAEVFAMSV